jgi:hypothetical protein
MARKTHIRIPSVEGQLGYPRDLVEKYKQGAGNGDSNGNGTRNGGATDPGTTRRGSRPEPADATLEADPD